MEASERYVSVNDGQETLFGDGRSGLAPALGSKGSNYEFRLYNSDHTELLVKVAVARARSNLRRKNFKPVSCSEGGGRRLRFAALHSLKLKESNPPIRRFS